MDEPRRTTVTFLFTDIAGSTRMLKELREAWGDVLADHQRILRDAFARHGGREIDTQGDAFFVSFTRARDAVLAAADAQRALSMQPWPSEEPLRVRIGIHTGEALASEDRFVGLAVHRAARICAAAHGGQVLVSQTTQNLIEDEEAELPALTLRDLGPQRLKDLDRPVRLYQLGGDGLLDSFPPLRTADAPFAGREGELAEEAAEAIAADEQPPLRRRAKIFAALVGGAMIAGAVAVVAASLAGGSSSALVPPNSVGVIDPATNKLVDHVRVGAQGTIGQFAGTLPLDRRIAVGAGAVWVANKDDRSISRIEPKTLGVHTIVGIDGTIDGLVVAANGDVWATLEADSLDHVARGSVEHVTLPNPNGPAFSFSGIAADAHALWLGRSDETSLALVRFDPVRQVPAGRPTPIGSKGLHSIAVRGGYVWVTNSTDSSLLKIDATTMRPAGRARIGSAGSVAVGGGKVWVTSQNDNQLWFDDTQLSQPLGSTNVGHGPMSVAYGAGSVWVANYDDGTVSRVDPNTQQVEKTITVGRHVSSIAVAGGKVWVIVPPG